MGVMETKNWIHLSIQEALDAIAFDFTQYGPQPGIFHQLAPILSDNRIRIVSSENDNTLWIQHSLDHPMELINLADFGFFVCHLLETADYSTKKMADICAIVFQTQVRTSGPQKKSDDGIWIKNHMDEFDCIQCGHCCRSLGYESECTRDDMAIWQEHHRKDIIERVLVTRTSDDRVEYRIWWDQLTGKLFESCPWLEPNAANDRFKCLIHNMKPEICRQYPYTKKHAAMTGCKGKFPLP